MQSPITIRFNPDFWSKDPCVLSYNRLPLLANVVYDADYKDVTVKAQHSYPFHHPFEDGDVVFVKTDFLPWFLNMLKTDIGDSRFVLVTGVSDRTPSKEECEAVLKNQRILFWIGCNIPYTHHRIQKILIGVGEPSTPSGNLPLLKSLHEGRVPWNQKKDSICIPYHGDTHSSRTRTPTLPKLPYEDYMCEISKYKYVIVMRGSGMDTHRFSEVLLMGSVPIVQSSPLDDLYQQFPCIIVDSLDNVNPSEFVWDPVKYEEFLNMFWIRPTFVPVPMIRK
jgi:hypothetical protein